MVASSPFAARSRVLARLASVAQIGELARMLLLNVQWDLDWELRILLQDWPPKSAQIGKNDIQFPANFLRILQFKLTGLFECLRLIHKYALSLLFHLKSWFAEKLNYATAFARVYKQYLPRNVNITFAVIKKNR